MKAIFFNHWFFSRKLIIDLAATSFPLAFQCASSEKNLFYITFALLAGIYVWHCLAVNFVMDDAFISFQYVKNFVRGEGLVYNPGERVEGYTNFLWVILLSGFHWLLPQISLLYIAQILGIFFGVLTILLVCRFSRIYINTFWPICMMGGTFLAFHSGFSAWGTAGLETTMFAFLIFAGAYAFISYLRTGRKFLLAPLVFAIASLTRPDGLLFFIITTAYVIVTEKKRGEKQLFWRLLMWMLVFSSIYLPYFIWSFSYYGYPVPNTFYAKVGSGIHQYIRGVGYLWHYIQMYGFFIFIPPLLTLLRRKRVYWRDYLALLVSAYVIYLVYVGGDGLGFFRFVVHIAPLIYLLVSDGFDDIYIRIKRFSFVPAGWKQFIPAMLIICISLTFTMRQSVFPVIFSKHYMWYEPQSELSFPVQNNDNTYVWFDNYFVDRLATAARWLETNAQPNSLVASTPAGSIAYHMNLNVIDMLGLNDVHIAHTEVAEHGRARAGHEKGNGKYVLARSPDYILMGNVAVLPKPLDKDTMANKLVRKSEHELWEEPEFHRNYELVSVRLATTGIFQYFTFFKKKDN